MFEQENALANLNAFTSLNGAAFYELEPNSAKVRLVRKPEPAQFPGNIAVGDETVTIFDPGMPIHWHVDHTGSA